MISKNEVVHGDPLVPSSEAYMNLANVEREHHLRSIRTVNENYPHAACSVGYSQSNRSSATCPVDIDYDHANRTLLPRKSKIVQKRENEGNLSARGSIADEDEDSHFQTRKKPVAAKKTAKAAAFDVLQEGHVGFSSGVTDIVEEVSDGDDDWTEKPRKEERFERIRKRVPTGHPALVKPRPAGIDDKLKRFNEMQKRENERNLSARGSFADEDEDTHIQTRNKPAAAKTSAGVTAFDLQEGHVGFSSGVTDIVEEVGEADDNWKEKPRQEKRFERIRKRVPTGHPALVKPRPADMDDKLKRFNEMQKRENERNLCARGSFADEDDEDSYAGSSGEEDEEDSQAGSSGDENLHAETRRKPESGKQPT